MTNFIKKVHKFSMLKENIISLKDCCNISNISILTGKSICRYQKVNVIKIDEESY